MNPANIALALNLLITLGEQIQRIGSLVSNAQAQNRDISEEELSFLREADDAARTRLEEAILAAKTRQV